nr:pyridoxal-phosphate dependent enzyme [Kutzneria sp. 744]
MALLRWARPAEAGEPPAHRLVQDPWRHCGPAVALRRGTRRRARHPSAGNMAWAVAWLAHEHVIPCTAVVPEHIPEAKAEAFAAWGADVVRLPFADWWTIMETGVADAFPGTLVHPFADPRVVAGNAAIGLEIARDFPDVETVLVPFGGGGLSLGVAAAVKALVPSARILAVEVSTAAPLSAAWAAGHPVDAPYAATWIDGIGSPRIANTMWPLA